MPDQKKFWDSQADRYDKSISDHDDVYNARLTRTLSRLESADTVLDFGCASGEIALDIAPYVKHVDGIDVSPKMIRRAKQKATSRAIKNANFSTTDLFDRGLNPQSYNTILAFNIFHLVDNPVRALTRLHELLQPNGLLISQTPCMADWHWAKKSLIRLALGVGIAPRIHSFTHDNLQSLITIKGFTIIETEISALKTQTRWIVAEKR